MRLRETNDIQTRRELLPKHYGESLIIRWDHKDYALGAGTSDSVTFYRDLDDPDTLWVLTTNWHLDYVGLEELNYAFTDPHDTEPKYYVPTESNSLFFDNLSEVKDYGTPLLDMAGYNIIRYLSQWLGY